MLEIKRINGNTLMTFEEVPEGSTVRRVLMGEHYLKLVFTLDSPIYFRIGDYVDTDFGRFELTKQYKPKYNTSTSGYDYTLQLDAYYIKWKNKKVRYMPEYGAKEVTFKLTANIDTHLNVVLRTINALGAKDSNFRYNGQPYVVQLLNFPESKRATAKYYLYDKTDIISALDGLAQLYECEWWVEDNIIFFGKCEIGSSIVDISIESNADEMTRSEADTKYATRLYAFGSTRNLPHNFEDVGADVTIDGVVEKRLTLPTNLCPNGYLEDVDIQNEAEAIEGVIVNDDIYPKVLCEVSAVETYTDNVENEDGTITSQTFYRLKDSSGFQFSEDMILEGESLHILFQSGSMNGMDFECHYDNEGKYYEVIVNEDYGRLLPDATLHPVVGMKFVLYNWDATKIEATGIIDTAKKELYDYTLDYLNESKIDPSTYECTLKSVWVYNDGLHFRNFDMGTRVNLVNDAFFEESRTSRIIGFEIKLDKPYDTPKYTVGEKAAYSRRKDMERQIEAVTVNGNAYVSSSGIGGGTSIYVIKRYDGAIPSDYNVFSAKRSMDEFLSRKMDDMATGLITFVKGLVSKARALFEGDVDIQGLLRGARAQFEGDIQVGGDLDVTGRERIDRIQSHNYSGSGLADTGYMITSDDGTGSSMAVLDYLTIRKKMIVNSIEVKETHFSAGDIAHTLASCEIARTDYLYVDESGGEELLGYSRIKVPWLLRGAALVLGVDNGIVRGLYSRYKRVRLTLTEEQLRRCNRIRCYFLSKDGDREIENWFRPNDLVRCQTWNVVRERRETFTPDFNDHAGNVYYWRKIHDVSWNTGETRYVARDSEGQPTDGTTTVKGQAYVNEGGVARLADNGIHGSGTDSTHAPKEIDGNTYHWFDVDYDYVAEQAGGTGSADKGSDIPAAGDKVVQFGNTTDPDRMNIYLIEVNGAGNPDAPDWKMYRGVYTFNLNQCWWGGESCMKTKWSVSTGIEAYAPSFKWITEYGRARQVITREEGFWSSIALECDDWSNYRQLSDYPDYSDDILDSSGNFVSRVNGKPKNWVRKCRYYDQLTHNGSVWLCSRAESFYWRDKDGNMVSSRVEGAEYVRDYTTQEPSEAAGDWTEQVGKGDPGAFKSQVFCRSNSTPSAPSNERKNGYNTYDNPVPPAVSGQPTWTDGAPGGTAILWMSTAWFHSDGTHSDWTTPRQQTDTETLDVEFSPNATQPSTPAGTAADKDTSSVKAQRHAQGWYDPNDTLPTPWTWSDMVWRAERRISNGVYYGNWTVSRIKGENSVRIDLTNENDTMLYSSSKGLVSGNVLSTAYLFDGSDDVSDSESTTWQVSASGCTLTSGNSRNIVVTGMTAMTAKVTVTATYTDRNKVVYTRSTQLTLKKIIDGDKYDLDITPSSIAYNVSKDSPATSDLTIRVWRTAVDGTHTLSAPPSGYYVFAGGKRLAASSTGTYSFTTDNSTTSGVQVMIAKSADGTDTLDSETIPVVKAEDGTSPYFADIDNEMHSVACDKNGSTLEDFDLTVGVSLWHGSTPLDLTTLTTDTPEGFTITANKSAKTIRIQVAKGTAIAEVNDIRITVAGSGSGEHSLHFTLNGVRQGENGEPAVLYSLVPSVSSVVKKKDGTYSVDNVSCTRQKNVGGTITNNTTDGDITYKLDGGTEKAYTNNTDIAVTSFTKSIQFIFKVDGKTVDVETILMVADGEDGKTPTISIGSNGHWIINGTDTGVTAEGKDGTGVAIKGTVASTGKLTIENGKGYAVPMKDDGTDGTKTEAKHGDCYICDSNRHLYMFTTEPAVAWNDLGEFKGEPGKSSYMHIAWADKVTFSGGSYATIEGFIKVYDGNPHDWVGFATDNSAEDPSDWKAYKWNYQRGADGSGTEYVYLLTKEGFKPTLNQISGSGTPSEDEFLPSVGNYQSGKIYGDSRYFEDDPPASVSEDWPALWWASRKFRDGQWQHFGDVTLHNRYSKDGENSVRLDLDNENDSILYDGSGNKLSGNVVSNVTMYDGAVDVSGSTAFTIDAVSGGLQNNSDYVTLVGRVLTVKRLTSSGTVTVKGVYNGIERKAVFSVKYLSGVDKFDIIVSPNAFSVNTDNTVTDSDIRVWVYRTPANGGQRQLVSFTRSGGTYTNTYGLTLSVTGSDGTALAENTQGATTEERSFSMTAALKKSLSNVVVVLGQSVGGVTTEHDRETLPVNQVQNGADGSGANAVKIDLDNPFDSIPCDSDGVVMAQTVLTTHARVYDGASAVGSGVSVTSIDGIGSYAAQSSVSDGVVTITWTVPKGVTLGSDRYACGIELSWNGKPFFATFVATVVRSGEPGKSPTIYQLLTNPSELAFSRNDNNELTGEVTIRSEVKKSTGEEVERLTLSQAAEIGLGVRYRWDGTGNWAAMSDNMKVSAATAGGHEYMYLELYGTTDNFIHDYDTLEVVRDGRKGKDGANSIRLALDNEHEDFLYDGTTLVAPSAGASSLIRLYDGGNDITASMPAPEIQSVSGTTKGTGGAYISNKTLYVKSITASTCEVVVKCTYNGADYFAKFTANKTNQDKYDIVCKPSSIAYNSTTHASKSSSATIQTVSLSATGIGIGGTSLSPSLSTSVGAGSLCVFWAPVNSNGIIGGFAPSPVTSKAVTKQECESYVGIYFELRYYTSSSNYRICDYETVEIAKTKDGDSIQGEPGDNGVGLVVNPSSLILNEDSDASGQAYIREANNTATIRLYEGGAAQKITVTKQNATNYTWNGDELTGNGTSQVTMTLNVGNIASGDNVRTGSIALRATSEDGNVIDFSVPFYVNRLQTFSRVIDKGVEKALGEAHVYEMNPDGTVKDSEYLYKQVNSAKGAITTLQNTVGNASGGLVKQVSTLEQTAKGITSRVSRTEEKVALLSNKEELLDLTGLDSSKAYPVTINLRTGSENTSERIMCGVERPLNASYNAATSPDYYGHDTMGFMTILKWTTFQSGWGAIQVPTDWSTDDKKRYIDTFDKYWLSPSTAKVAGSIGQVIEVNKEFVYLRGGSKYRVYTSKSDAEIELHPSGVTITYRTGSRTLSVINASDIVEPVQDRQTKEQVSSEIRQTADSISLSVRSGIESSLRETGIDIVDKIITMKAEQTIFKDLSGREMISFEMVEYDGSQLPSLVFWDNKGKKGGNKSFVLNWKGLLDMSQHSASMLWGNVVMLGTLNGNRSFANGSKIYAEALWFNKEERDGVKPSIDSVTKYMYYAGYTVVAGKKTWNPADAGDYDGKTYDSDATSQLYLPTGTPTAGWYISEITEYKTGTKVWRKIFSFTHYTEGMPDSVLSVCVDALEVYEIQGQVASIEYQFVDGLTDSSVTTGSDSLGNYMIVPTA